MYEKFLLFRVDVICEVKELLLSVGLCRGEARQQTLRAFTAPGFPHSLYTQPISTPTHKETHILTLGQNLNTFKKNT